MDFTSRTILALALAAACPASAADIYTTGFNDYSTGTLSGQLVWIPGGTWAVSGAVNTPQIAANVIGSGVDPGIDPVGGSGRMVRLCTERFNAGRTKAWLDLLNTGKWAAASAGGNGVLETSVAGKAAQEGFSRLLLFLTMLSANLAVINFLPIPVLDGGHMVFLVYELVRGKPPSEGVVAVLSYIGLALLLTLMLFVFSLDLAWIPRMAEP